MSRERLGHVQRDIDPNLIQKAHRAHGHSEIEHRFIQVFNSRSRFEQMPGLDQIWHQNPIHQKAGTVFNYYRELADLLHKTQSPLQNLRRGLSRGNDLDELHSMDRIEEMQANDAFWPA